MEDMAGFEPAIYRMQSTEPPKMSENEIYKFYLFLSIAMLEAG